MGDGLQGGLLVVRADGHTERQRVGQTGPECIVSGIDRVARSHRLRRGIGLCIGVERRCGVLQVRDDVLVDLLVGVVGHVHQTLHHLAVGDRAVDVGHADHHGGADQVGDGHPVARALRELLYLEQVAVDIEEHRVVGALVPVGRGVERIEVLTAPTVREGEVAAQCADHLVYHLRVVLLDVHHGVDHRRQQHRGIGLLRSIGIGVVFFKVTRATGQRADQQDSEHYFESVFHRSAVVRIGV